MTLDRKGDADEGFGVEDDRPDCVLVVVDRRFELGPGGSVRFDLVAGLFGSMTMLSRIVYTLVGLAAVYDLVSLPYIMRRWEIHIHHRPAHVHA